MCSNRQRGSWTELLLYFRIRPCSSPQHRSLIPLLCASALICMRTPHTQTCTLLYAHGCPFFFSMTHPDRMKNACCKLSAAPLSLIPHYSPSSSSSSRQAPLLSLISHTHFSMAWRCLVNLLKLYGGDTQLVASALTRPKKKRLGLLQTGALNGKQTGLYWAAGAFHILRQYSSFVKVTQSVILAPSPWFVHAGVCLQSKGAAHQYEMFGSGGDHSFFIFFF